MQPKKNHPSQRNTADLSQITPLQRAVRLSLMSAVIGLGLGLTACGGGGDSSSSVATTSGSTTTNTTTAVTTIATTPTAAATTAPATTIAPATTTATSATTVSPQIQATLDLLNAKRQQCGFGTVTYNTELTKAAINHANYMNYVATQNHAEFANHEESVQMSNGIVVSFTGGSNPYYSGVLPQNRLQTGNGLGANAVPVSYNYQMQAENLSSQEVDSHDLNYTLNPSTEAEMMLSQLFAAPYHLRELVNPALTQVGMAYRDTSWQAGDNKHLQTYLEIVSATPAGVSIAPTTSVLTYPCTGVTGAEYQLNDETPNPLGTRNLQSNPIGQPVYVLAPTGKTIATADMVITNQGVSIGLVHPLTKSTDLNQELGENEAFFLPDQPLKPATTYAATYTLTYTTGETVQNSFSFTTKAA